MSFQVGQSCYADYLSAATAYCSRFGQVSAVENGEVRTVTCQSADDQGRLVLFSSKTNTAQGYPDYSTTYQYMSYPSCIQSDYLAAAETIFGAVLTAWAVCYGMWKVYRFMMSSARTPE